MWQSILTLSIVAVLCVPTSAWDTRYDAEFSFSCNNNQVISRIQSLHRNDREDRVFDFECGNLPQQGLLTQCSWSGYANDYDKPVSYICPANKVMVGISSVHNNGKEDRRYKFLCCRLQGKVTHTCAVSAYANDFDEYFNYVVPSGRVLTGMFSHHVNSREDRRFKFITCILGNNCN